MNLVQFLIRSASAYPTQPAVFLGERCLHDYRGLAARAASLGGYLRNTLQLSPGERVAIYMTNCPEYIEVLYGAWWAGLVVVPINAKLHPREVAFVLNDAQASCFFVSADLASDMSSELSDTPRHQADSRPGHGRLRQRRHRHSNRSAAPDRG